MLYVIERDREYYAGFADGRPTWQRKCRPETQFSADVAEKILRQLTALGYGGVEIKLYEPRRSKRERRAPE